MSFNYEKDEQDRKIINNILQKDYTKGNKMENKKYVYLVRQTQLVDDYNKTTIAVFDDREQAEKLARALNKEYGRGCVFDDNWDFVEWTCEIDDINYYDIDCQEINPDMKKYWEITE